MLGQQLKYIYQVLKVEMQLMCCMLQNTVNIFQTEYINDTLVCFFHPSNITRTGITIEINENSYEQHIVFEVKHSEPFDDLNYFLHPLNQVQSSSFE